MCQEIKKNKIIEGKNSTLMFTKGDISVYKSDSEKYNEVLFFIKNDILLFTQTISADSCQNNGYVSEINFS